MVSSSSAGGALPLPFEDSDDEGVAPETAGHAFFDYLTDLKVRNRLSAKDVCILAYWAAAAGANGPATQLAKPPGGPSTGHYGEHC